MELSPTAYVILGFLDARPRSGYEIKQTVDNSTRFFWAASYGQIYPELRRLAGLGLVESKRDDDGGRRRQIHRVTAAGRRELRGWLQRPAETFETRDEWLLKLFFARSTGRATAAALVRSKSEFHTALAARLREIEPKVVANGNPHQLSVLRYGIAMNEWSAEYWIGA